MPIGILGSLASSPCSTSLVAGVMTGMGPTRMAGDAPVADAFKAAHGRSTASNASASGASPASSGKGTMPVTTPATTKRGP